MTTIYIHKGEYGHGEACHALIRACAEDFCAENGIARTSFEIVTAENGKPFFADGPGDGHVDLSVSNSGDYWVCAVSTEPCGVDVQVEEDRDTDAIARRMFKPGELEYIRKEGPKGFYKLWTRREAYGKLTGKGFFGPIPDLVNKNGQLLNEVPVPAVLSGSATDPTVALSDIEVGDPFENVHCSLCSFGDGYCLRSAFCCRTEAWGVISPLRA